MIIGNQSFSESISREDLHILKVNQLDGELLDAEILRQLNQYVVRIFTDSSIVDSYGPELNFLLSSLIYRYSVYEYGQSFGDSLQNLRYRNEFDINQHNHTITNISSSSIVGGEIGLAIDGIVNSTRIRLPYESAPTKLQKYLHFIATTVVPYIWVRLFNPGTGWFFATRTSVNNVYIGNYGNDDHFMEDDHSSLMMWNRIVHLLEISYRLICVLNFFVFLYDGRYRSVVDRMLGMRVVYARPFMTRNISFDFLSRELVWSGFLELLLFLVQVVDVHGLWRSLLGPTLSQDHIHNRNGPLHRSSSNDAEGGINKKVSAEGSMNMLAEGPVLCGFCQEEISVPYRTNCNHIYCYYCLKQRLREHTLIAASTSDREIEGALDLDDDDTQHFRCVYCRKMIYKIERLNLIHS